MNKHQSEAEGRCGNRLIKGAGIEATGRDGVGRARGFLNKVLLPRIINIVNEFVHSMLRAQRRYVAFKTRRALSCLL